MLCHVLMLIGCLFPTTMFTMHMPTIFGGAPAKKIQSDKKSQKAKEKRASGSRKVAKSPLLSPSDKNSVNFSPEYDFTLAMPDSQAKEVIAALILHKSINGIKNQRRLSGKGQAAVDALMKERKKILNNRELNSGWMDNMPA